MKTVYKNMRTEERTEKATIALQWHHGGDDVGIIRKNVDGLGKYYNVIDGAKVEPKPDENREQCKSISDELDKYVDGLVYTCPDCNSKIEIPETVGDRFKCPCCKEVHDIDEYEQLSLYDYFDGDVLDIDYLVNHQKKYKGVKICVAWGGPSIYISTISGDVELYWWTESAKYRMRSDVIDAIDEWAEEYYNCL